MSEQQHRNKSGFETRAIHAGYEPDPTTGAVIPPIYATSTYKQDGVGGLRGGYEYSRSANPTRTALEGASRRWRRGSAASRSPPGWPPRTPWSAALCRPGDHVVIPDDAYGGTLPALRQGRAAPGGSSTAPAPVSDVDAVARRDPARADQAGLGRDARPTRCSTSATSRRWPSVAHDAGALLVVDNTFASPYLQQPLTLGADVVVHSTTKYAGGHSDVVGGAVVVRDLELAEQVALPPERDRRGRRAVRRFLTLRGLKTLGVRMDRHCDNAERVVEFLTGHPAVDEVDLPRPRGAPRARGRRPADEALRRDGVVPGHRRRGAGARGLRARRGVHPRRVARRRRVADRAPGPDDPRERRRHRPRGARPT